MNKRMEVTLKKFVEDLNKYCETKATCGDCPPELAGCCEVLTSFKELENIVNVLYPKTFGEELLEQFPFIDFDAMCPGFFFGKEVSDSICKNYESCTDHFMSCTREELLKELE